MSTLKEKLTLPKQKQVIEKQFQRLKDKFLTPEQSLRVHLTELPEYYWLVNNPWSYGLTYYDYTIKNSHMYVSIRLFFQHEKLDTLLDTIAHEFAHVYLNFTNPQHKHDKEHTKQKNYFLKYLKVN